MIPFLFLLLCPLAADAAERPFGYLCQDKGQPKIKHTTPPPIHSAKGVICSAFSVDHFKFPRGLRPTSRTEKEAAQKFSPQSYVKAPAQIVMLPKILSMWGNDQYGDCVSASEAARIAAWSVFCGLPETVIPDQTLISWASAGGYLNGANLTDVMTDRQKRGMADASGKLYLAGQYTSVDYTNENTLQTALSQGPVNFGIDANALPSAAGNANGWYAFGGTPGSFNNEDHCTPSFGYITGATSVVAAFQAISQAYGVTVAPPANAPTGNVYLWFTWSTVGVVDFAWIMSTAGEAWIENPTTVGQTPQPGPAPTPTPTPTPGTGTIIVQIPGMTDQTFSLNLPAASPKTVVIDGVPYVPSGGAKPPPTPQAPSQPCPQQKQIDDLKKRMDDSDAFNQRAFKAILDKLDKLDPAAPKTKADAGDAKPSLLTNLVNDPQWVRDMVARGTPIESIRFRQANGVLPMK